MERVPEGCGFQELGDVVLGPRGMWVLRGGGKEHRNLSYAGD